MSAKSAAVLGFGLLIGTPVAFVVATVLTTVWFNRIYLPRIAADFDPGPGLWLEKRDG